jgi:hypothetical protein
MLLQEYLMGIKMIRLLLLLGLMALPVAAETLNAAQVLAKARQAAGGAAWDQVQSIYAKGKAKVAGFDTDREEWVDLLKVRYAQRFSLGFIKGGLGFDGVTAWGQEPNKPVNNATTGEFYSAQVTNAYRRSYAFWFPDRWEAKATYLGEKESEGKKFQVVEMSPQGGKPLELWFDSSTYLLGRSKAQGAPVYVTFNDYRRVEGLLLPFNIKAGDQGNTNEAIALNRPVTDETYQAPVFKTKDNKKS